MVAWRVTFSVANTLVCLVHTSTGILIWFSHRILQRRYGNGILSFLFIHIEKFLPYRRSKILCENGIDFCQNSEEKIEEKLKIEGSYQPARLQPKSALLKPYSNEKYDERSKVEPTQATRHHRQTRKTKEIRIATFTQFQFSNFELVQKFYQKLSEQKQSQMPILSEKWLNKERFKRSINADEQNGGKKRPKLLKNVKKAEAVVHTFEQNYREGTNTSSK